VNLDESVRVYPNPVRDELRIESSAVEMQKVELFDLNGRLVLTEVINSGIASLQVGVLQSGTYIVRVVTEEGIVSKRIVKK
jgi:hypothetical protein